MNSHAFNIDEGVEIFVPRIQQWVLGVITYHTQNRVCVKYDIRFADVIGAKRYEWISIDSIAKKYTHYQRKSAIYNPIREGWLIMSAPLCYTSSDNQNYLAIHERRSDVFFVHKNDKESLFTWDLPRGLARDYFMAYASDSDTLYLVNKEVIHNRNQNRRSYITLMSTHVDVSLNDSPQSRLEWQYDNYQLPAFNRIAFDDLNGANMTFVPAPINEFHFVRQHYHFKCVPKANHFVFIGAIDICMQTNDDVYQNKLIYVESMKRMFLFGTVHIYCCVIATGIDRYEWTIFAPKLTLPNQPNDYHLLLVFDHIVFLYFMGGLYDVYCMDLYDGKLLKCGNFSEIAYLNRNLDKSYLVSCACSHGIAHFIGDKHYKWSLNDLIPKQIQDKHYKSVMKFVSIVQNTNQLYDIVPLCISKLILFFYSSIMNVSLIRGQLGRDGNI
eukprot:257980_1